MELKVKKLTYEAWGCMILKKDGKCSNGAKASSHCGIYVVG